MDKGSIWIKGYNESFQIVPGEGLISVSSEIKESFGNIGYNLRYAPKGGFCTLNIVLPSQKCEFECSYCCAVTHEKFISPSNIEFTEKVLKALPVDSIVFGGKGEYIKIKEAHDFIHLCEIYGVFTTMTGNLYVDEIESLLNKTKLVNSSVSIEIPTGDKNIDRGEFYDAIFNSVNALNKKYPGRLSFIPLIPLDGNIITMLPYIKKLEQSDLCCSWSIIYPVKNKRNGDNNISFVNSFTTLLQQDLRVCNFLSQSVIDVILHGFTCLGIHNLYIIGDVLIACPVRKIKVEALTLDSIYEAQNKAASYCKTYGNFLNCPFFSVPAESGFSFFVWNYLAIIGERVIKSVCKNDFEIYSLLKNKFITGGWHSAYNRKLQSGEFLNCTSNPILFSGN